MNAQNKKNKTLLLKILNHQPLPSSMKSKHTPQCQTQIKLN